METTRGIEVKEILLSRNASTAISFAAFNTQGIVPPSLASYDKTERMFFMSGASKVSSLLHVQMATFSKSLRI
jgi:hypothetical protein